MVALVEPVPVVRRREHEVEDPRLRRVAPHPELLGPFPQRIAGYERTQRPAVRLPQAVIGEPLADGVGVVAKDGDVRVVVAPTSSAESLDRPSAGDPPPERRAFEPSAHVRRARRLPAAVEALEALFFLSLFVAAV